MGPAVVRDRVVPLFGANGSSHTFANVYSAHFARVYGWVSRIAPQADAEDITQEVFLVVHAKLSEFEEDRAQLSTWLFRIAYNVTGSYLRRTAVKRRLRTWLSTAPDGEAHDSSDAEHRLVDAQRSAAVRAAVDRLSLAHRTVIVMHELEGWPCEQVASALEVPLATVYTRLHYARKRLARSLSAFVLEEDQL